ncbi:unnamed protein product [Musa banksii]
MSYLAFKCLCDFEKTGCEQLESKFLEAQVGRDSEEHRSEIQVNFPLMQDKIPWIILAWQIICPPMHRHYLCDVILLLHIRHLGHHTDHFSHAVSCGLFSSFCLG